MTKHKFHNKIILVIFYFLFGVYCFAPLDITTVQARQTQQGWQPRRIWYSSYMGSHLYSYTLASGGLMGIYDDRGFILYRPQFRDIVKIPNHIFAVNRNGLWGVLDNDGSIIIPFEYDSIQGQHSGDISILQKNGYYGWINQYGKLVKTPQYTYLKLITYDLLSACAPNGGCGILVKNNGKEFLPLVFDGVIDSHINDVYFSISNKNGKYGVINVSGNLVIDCILPTVDRITNDVIYTKNGKLEGLASINSGKIILEPVYQNIVELAQQGYFKMKSNRKWGVVDYDGNIIYPCQYGTFEINRIMKKKYPNGTKYKSVYEKNMYESKLLSIEYYAKIYNGINKKSLDKLLENNPPEEIKIKAENLAKKYGFDN